jgi:hypothetical protein
MAHVRAVGTARANEARFRDLLYKSDHARPIDQYIDFFGEGGARGERLDCCGDLLLGSLA